MPARLQPDEPAGVARRTLVGGFLSGVLLASTGACSTSAAPGAPGAHHDSGSAPPADPDAGLLVALRSAELGLIAQYDAVIAQYPALSARLSAVRADHAAHLAAVGGSRPEPTGTPSAAPQLEMGQAVASLAGAERSAAGARIGDCRGAHDPALARMIAAIGGSEAAHAALLAELAAQHPPGPTKSSAPAKHPATSDLGRRTSDD
jgi:hypothetical protein